jgi:hypothetical protein
VPLQATPTAAMAQNVAPYSALRFRMAISRAGFAVGPPRCGGSVAPPRSDQVAVDRPRERSGVRGGIYQSTTPSTRVPPVAPAAVMGETSPGEWGADSLPNLRAGWTAKNIDRCLAWAYLDSLSGGCSRLLRFGSSGPTSPFSPGRAG